MSAGEVRKASTIPDPFLRRTPISCSRIAYEHGDNRVWTPVTFGE